MITALYRSTEATDYLGVTRQNMADQLQWTVTYQTDKIDRRIAAATQWLQDFTQRGIVRNTQAYTMKLDRWPTNSKEAISIPFAPVYSGGTFTLSYLDTAGASQNLVSGTDYILNGETSDIPTITPTSGGWPSLYSSDDRDLITLVYTVGYSTVPAWAEEAILAYGTYLNEEHDGYRIMAESMAKPHKIYFDWKLND